MHDVTGLPAMFAAWHDNGDQQARDALVERFLPLARKLARRYSRSSEPFDDLLQVASLGLAKAIDRFDPSHGASFPSFAVPTILGELRRYFRDCGWAVHVTRGDQERAKRVEAAQRELTLKHGRSPTVAALAQELEMSEEDVLNAIQIGGAYDALSLEAPSSRFDDGEAASLLDVLGSEEDGFDRVDASASIATAIAELPERERLILELRFRKDMTQSEIGEVIGISQMHVSRLLRRSLERLRELTGAEEETGEASP